MEAFEPRVLMSAASWDGGGGNSDWNNPLNWNRGGVDAVPLDGDSVTISVAANPTINFSSGTLQLASLITDEALTITGGTLGLQAGGTADINNTLTVNGGILSGGAWDVAGGLLTGGTTGTGSRLVDMAITGDVTLNQANAHLRVEGSTTFTNLHLAGNNTSVGFAPGYTLTSPLLLEGSGSRWVEMNGTAGALNIGAGGSIRSVAGYTGQGNIGSTLWYTGVMALTNGGAIESDAGTLTINAGTFVNSGVLTAASGGRLDVPNLGANAGPISVGGTGSILTIGGAWSNASTISVSGGTLDLGGTFNTAGIGTLNRTGGVVNISGAWNNSSGSFTFNSLTGTWTLLGGSITGGTINSSGANVLDIGANGTNRLTGVAINGDLVLDGNSDRVRIEGATTFTAARMMGSTTSLALAPGYTLNAPIIMEGAATGSRVVEMNGSTGTVTIGPGGSIRTAAGFGGTAQIGGSSWFGGSMTLVNNGVIGSETGGRMLTISAAAFTNNATVQALNGGSIDVSNLMGNSGTIMAPGSGTAVTLAGTYSIASNITVGAGVTLTLNGAWSNGATVAVNGGTLVLGGSFTTAGIGTVTRSGGTVNIVGSWNNASASFTFNSSVGSWTLLGGTISGGTINYSGANALDIGANSTNRLTGVAINGDLVLDGNSDRVRIEGATTFTAARMMGSTTSLALAPGYVLNAPIIMEGAATGSRAVEMNGSTGTVTIGPGGSIRTAAGFGGTAQIGGSSWFGGSMTLVNNGVIGSETMGRQMTVNPVAFTNNGTLQALNGADLDVRTLTGASGPVTLSGAGTTVELDGSYTLWSGAAVGTGQTLTLKGAWSNAGTLAVNGGTLVLNGNFTTAGLGTVTRSGGTVNIAGSWNNGAASFTLDGAVGSWTLLGGVVTGGTLTETGGNVLDIGGNSQNKLVDVAINGELLLDSDNDRVQLQGSTSFAGARLQRNGTTLAFAPGYVLNSPVFFEGSQTNGRGIEINGQTGTVTIGPGGSLRTAPGFGGSVMVGSGNGWFGGSMTLVNNGLISAETSGRTITINPVAFTNNATLQAIGGGTLDVQHLSGNAGAVVLGDAGSAVTLNGTYSLSLPVSAGPGTTLNLNGNWANTSTINVNGATLNLGGAFDTSEIGTITRTGGMVNVTGDWNNASAAFMFNAATGVWVFSGTITGGSLNFADGTQFVVGGNSSSTRITNVAVNGEINVASVNARTRIEGSTTYTRILLSANVTGVGFSPGYTVSADVLGTAASGGVGVEVGASGTLTIAPGVTVGAAPGSGCHVQVGGTFWYSNPMTLVNNGRLTMGTNHTLTLNPATLTNNGVIEALNGGTVSIASAPNTVVTNISGNTLSGGAWIASGSSTFNLQNAVVRVNNADVTVGAASSFPALATLNANAGTLRKAGGGTFTITPAGGTLINSGNIVLTPTNILAVTGSFTQTATGSTTVQIQGVAPTDMGRLNVTGAAMLNGNVAIVPVNGWNPECVNRTFLSAASVAGEYATRTLPPVAGHQSLLVYIGGEVRFAISPPSDYNRDGVLNSQDVFDFLVSFFNANADFNHDGQTNSQDFFDFIADFFRGCP